MNQEYHEFAREKMKNSMLMENVWKFKRFKILTIFWLVFNKIVFFIVEPVFYVLRVFR